MVYHERALHNYLIPRHGKYSNQHNQCDISAAHDGKSADVIPSGICYRFPVSRLAVFSIAWYQKKMKYNSEV